MTLGSGGAVAIASAADRDPGPGPTANEGPVPGALRFRRYPWPSAVSGPGAIGSRRAVAAASRVRRSVAVAVALGLALALPTWTGAQSAPAFTGRYRFVLTVAPSCPASMQVGPISVLMDVTETTVSAGPELSGKPASPSQTPDNGRFELLRQGSRIHGPFGARTDKLGLDSEGIYRVWMEVMLDGATSIASSGRSRASGTAFGEVEFSLASDPTGEPVGGGTGNCGFATTGHQWSLEPA